MLNSIVKNTALLIAFLLFSCGNSKFQHKNSKTVYQNSPITSNNPKKFTHLPKKSEPIITAANQTEEYVPLLSNKRIGVVANQTSVIFKAQHLDNHKNSLTANYTHLIDSLLNLEVNITKVFAPEHGFRGTADAGEFVNSKVDEKSGLPIISLYGKNKKPLPEQLEDLDLIVFDIQDVGVRFYTYISTLHYVMEACAENGIPLIVLDRPNPNGHYVDGPVMEAAYQSFVGMHPVPIVYGMTIGEYAYMINGEKWLANSVQCNLRVIPLKNYTHQTRYNLPIKPSPNLPNAKAVNLYPSLCLFEGTTISVGRGTKLQFQVYGAPYFANTQKAYCFTPLPNLGSKHPKYENKICCGVNLTHEPYLEKINLSYLTNAYNKAPDKTHFFNSFFIKLSGTKNLRKQIEKGYSEQQIKSSWKNDLNAFKNTRKKYLLYR